jgi:hypothetical protein
MAKGKHSTALFEVIQADKRFQKKTTRDGALRTPKWWFKSPGWRPGDSGTNSTESDPAPSDNAAAATTPRADAQESAAPAVAPEAAPAPVAAATVAEEVVVEQPSGAPSRLRRPAWLGGKSLALDPDRHVVTVRLKYNTAIVSGFAALVMLGLAYVIGRQVGNGPAATYAGQSTDEVKAGPVQRNVMDVRPSGAGSSGNAARPNAGRPSARSGGATGGLANVPVTRLPANTQPPAVNLPPVVTHTPAPGAVPGAAAVGVPRQVNLNYVIIQSYPESERKMAEDAVQVLERGGVGATVEHGLRGYGNNLVVVGTAGFERGYNSTPEYQAYVKKIQRISDAAYKSSKGSKRTFKEFQPSQGYKWDKVGG